MRELEPLAHPFELGRTLLVAGAIQRRLKQKKSARELLQRAGTIFEDLQAPLWVERLSWNSRGRRSGSFPHRANPEPETDSRAGS